mmetsp:Transcript_48722/g.150952  ORF Transcript_48722/g.150952 Transcript_48722/m.150952 type:complete len:220 (-) Transcript_48722:481-1140(-)
MSHAAFAPPSPAAPAATLPAALRNSSDRPSASLSERSHASGSGALPPSPRATPSPFSANAAAQKGWSLHRSTGATSCGVPAQRPSCRVPAPPWCTTRLQRGKTAAYGANRTRRTPGAPSPEASSPPSGSMTRTALPSRRAAATARSWNGDDLASVMDPKAMQIGPPASSAASRKEERPGGSGSSTPWATWPPAARPMAPVMKCHGRYSGGRAVSASLKA